MKAKIDGKWSKPYPHQKSILETLMGGKGFHSGGIVSMPTGRRPSGPEPQFSGTPRTGAKPSEVKVSFEKPSGMGKSESLVGVDFADIEKRVMAQMAGRQHGKKLAFDQMAHDMAEFQDKLLKICAENVAKDLVKNMQSQIDEEGCGPFFAATKEWKE